MTVDIKETVRNRYLRILLKSVFIYSLSAAGFFLLFFIAIGEYLIAAIVAMLVFFLYYLYKTNRVVKIKQIKEKLVVLIDGKKDIELRDEDISYVFKLVRVTITENFVLFFAVKGDRFFSVKRYLFLNDPQNNLIEIFKNMHLEVTNIP